MSTFQGGIMTPSQRRALLFMLINFHFLTFFVLLTHTNLLPYTLPPSLSNLLSSKVLYVFPSALLSIFIAYQHRSYAVGITGAVVCSVGCIYLLHGLRALFYPQPEALALGLQLIAFGMFWIIVSVFLWYKTDRLPATLSPLSE